MSPSSLHPRARSPAVVTARPLVAKVRGSLAPGGHNVPSLSQTSSKADSTSMSDNESLTSFEDESTDENNNDAPVHKQRVAAAAVVPQRQQQTRPSQTTRSLRSSRQHSLPPRKSLTDSSSQHQQQKQQKRRRSPPPLRPSRSSTAAASGLLSLKRQRTSVRVPIADWLAAQPLVTDASMDMSQSFSVAMTTLESISSASLPSTESGWTTHLTTVSASMTTIATSTLRASIIAGTAWEAAIKWRTKTLGYQSQSRGHLSIKDWVRSLSGFSYESVNMWVKNAKLVRQYSRLGLLAVSWGQLAQRKAELEEYFETDKAARDLWSQSLDS